jgi:sarcosine oxidase subunit gamma
VTADHDPATDRRRSPVGRTGPGPHVLLAAGGVKITEIPFLAQANLRADPSSPAPAAVAERFGVRPPATPNRRAVAASGVEAIWLGPDEWLVVSAGDGPEVAAALETVVRPHGGTVVDVTAHRTVLEIRGPRARDILSSGTSVDLHPRAFAVGQAVQAPLARVDVILCRVDGDAWRVFVRTSFARYLVEWLTDAVSGD